MEKKKREKLTLHKLIEDNKKFEIVKEIKVLDDYVVNVRPYISSSHMEKIFIDFSNWIGDKNVLELIGDKPAIKYLMCFVVKSQTDLFTQVSYNNNIELYNIFQILLDSLALDEIISSIDKVSLGVIYARYSNIVKIAEKVSKIDRIMKKNENN